MKFLDKIKTILFDEEVVEENEQLPDMSSKKVKKGQTGFIDHGSDENDENPIVELVVPKEEPKEELKEEKVNESYLDNYKADYGREFEEDIRNNYKREEETLKASNFDLFDNEPSIIPSRSRNYDDLESSFMDEKEEKSIEVKSSYHRVTEPTKEKKEIKDYRKMLSDERNADTEKKPFKNTPVISPVWGILDKNYTPDEIVEKAEDLNKINSGVVPRSFGPVSYNDQPLPKSKVKKSEVSAPTREDLAEVNETISSMAYEDEVELIDRNIEEENKKIEEKIIKETSYEEDEIELPQRNINDFDNEEDAIISTDDYDNYDEIKTDDYDSYQSISEDIPTHSINDLDSGIDNEESTQNTIDDPFESDDYKSYSDNNEDDVVDFDSIVHKKKYDDEDEGLDNTIETDLFNLIDSMYKSEEDN